MGKWFKKCDAFMYVRDLIDETVETPRQCMKILNVLEICCDELTPNEAEDWEFYEDFRDMKFEIHETIEELDEDDYGNCKFIVNNLLTDFYDLCDVARVWLPL